MLVKSSCGHGYLSPILRISALFAGGIPIIEEHPSSLLLQVHEAGIFSCVADACLADQLCSGRWRINGSYTHSVNNQPLEEYVSKGFAFSDNRNGNRLTLMLIVNASEPIQNTSIYCEFDDGSIIKSDTAYLQVIRRQHNAEYTPGSLYYFYNGKCNSRFI